ncbi:hypothetical protein Poli38472_014342 [Pythium oligandrum]|uniref:Protein kinase domain-containing protein n=1 Tax=Pythium oligandrum TaxID=41045 RepID=A0A8K1C778_PYTOL|nr:hypothetical protein Poli38472_014342 [Pythium oligandrum]|eukprot:TMW57739.1 hypothetical protein Poli38472_014342 [Pythium oligandrum]
MTAVMAASPMVMDHCSVSDMTLTGACTNSSNPKQTEPVACVGYATTSCPSNPTAVPLQHDMLNVSDLGITRVVDVDAFYVDCHKLYMSGNQLTELSLYSKPLASLEVLDIAYNQIASFSSLHIPTHALSILNVSGNPLQRINLSESFSKLHELIAANASLSLLQTKDAGELLSVTASYNNFTSISKISCGNSLRYLDVAHNLISDWQSFNPPTGLHELHASWNGALNFTRGDWSQLDKLTVIDFSYNLVSNLTGFIFPSSLTQLNLYANPIARIDIRQSDFAILEAVELVVDETAPLFKIPCDSPHAERKYLTSKIPVCVFEDSIFQEMVDGSEQVPSSSPPPPLADYHSETSNTGLHVGVIVCVVVVVAIITYAFFWFRRRRLQGDNKARSAIDSEITETLQHPRFLTVRVDPDDVSVIKDLGRTSSFVIAAVSVGERQLWMKRVQRKLTFYKPQIASQLLDEIRIHSSLEHSKIVQFLGVSGASMVDLTMYCELMPNGNLAALLAGMRRTPGDWGWFGGPSSNLYGLPSKLDLAIDVVEALVYLQSYDPPVVHGDISPRNVLFSENWAAKLTGFRTNRDVNTAIVSQCDTMVRMAPEILRGEGAWSVEADMYTFGMLLIELDMGESPTNSFSGMRSRNKLASEILKRGFHPTLHPECPVEIQSLVQSCLRADPAQRPTSLMIHYDLSQLHRAKQRD